MQLLRRILCILALTVSSAAQADAVVLAVNGASGWWIALLVALGVYEQRRTVPEPSPQHISAPPRYAGDSCSFVAGVRHCPRAEPK
jgi:hypothetical protein